MWFCVFGLPIKYYNHCFIWQLAAKASFPLKVDALTSITSCEKFAHLHVEVDSHRSLVSKVTLKGESYPIKYEGLKLICFTCGKYGNYCELCSIEIEKNAYMKVGAEDVQVNRETNHKGKSAVVPKTIKEDY